MVQYNFTSLGFKDYSGFIKLLCTFCLWILVHLDLNPGFCISVWSLWTSHLISLSP